MNKFVGWLSIIYGFFLSWYFLERMYVDVFPYFDLTNNWFFIVLITQILYYLVPAILLIYLGNKFRK